MFKTIIKKESFIYTQTEISQQSLYIDRLTLSDKTICYIVEGKIYFHKEGSSDFEKTNRFEELYIKEYFYSNEPMLNPFLEL